MVVRLCSHDSYKELILSKNETIAAKDELIVAKDELIAAKDVLIKKPRNTGIGMQRGPQL